MNKPYLIVIPSQKKCLKESSDLIEVEAFLREATNTSDLQQACESLGAVVTIDITIAQELEKMAYTRGYHQAAVDRLKPEHLRGRELAHA